MTFGAAGLVGRAETDDAAAGDQARLVALARLGDRGGDRFRVVTIDAPGVPAAGLETGDLVVGNRERGRAVDGDPVVVEQHDQLGKPEMAGQRDRFVADAFHQTAVAGEHVGEMIDQIVAVAGVANAFGERHAHGVAKALAERSGRGFDARRRTVFGMPGSAAAQLAKGLDLFDGHVRITGEIEQGVKQHGPMAGRKHETVTVCPIRLPRIELQKPGKEHGCHIGHAQGHARVSAVGLLHGIHGQGADRVGQILVADSLVHDRCPFRSAGLCGFLGGFLGGFHDWVLELPRNYDF